MNHHQQNKHIKGKQALLAKMFLPFFIIGVFLLSGCKISYQVPVTGVDIQQESLSININEQETLTVQISPSNATNQNVTWTSEIESIATIDANGQVTGVSEGETTITVTTADGHFTDDCLITVTDGIISVTGLTLDHNSINLDVDDTFTLTPIFTPNNATNQNVSWSSDDTQIATITDGVVLGKSQGSCTITATSEDGHFTATCLVNVSTASIHVTSVSLSQNTMRVYVGDTATLIANILPSDATNRNVSWTSSNSTVATITNGVISALSVGSSTITATTDDQSYTDTCLLTVEAEETLSEKTIDSSANFSYGSYETNFGTGYFERVEYGFYRVSDDYSHSGMILLYPSTDDYDYQVLSGAFFNDTPISGIKKITVSYISTGGLVINYGPTKIRGYSQTLASTGTSNWTTTTISCSITSRYFSIETNGEEASIKSITIGYNSSLSTNTLTTENNDYRIAPTVYSGTLTDGVSSISVPNNITVAGNTYTINSYKTYTYYSYDYVSSHSGSLDLSAIAMTDPVDVANYYIAFHAIPANYGYRKTVSEDCGDIDSVKTLFSSDARQISQYSRTDGYATAVPWNPQDGGSTPVYYEFDIGLTSSYTPSSRGVGRVVMWVYGWSCYSDEAPVAVYTDDHYTTFSEYLNDGIFGSRFDSQPSSDGYRTGYINLEGSTQLTSS